jgi:hypothetical protein
VGPSGGGCAAGIAAPPAPSAPSAPGNPGGRDAGVPPRGPAVVGGPRPPTDGAAAQGLVERARRRGGQGGLELVGQPATERGRGRPGRAGRHHPGVGRQGAPSGGPPAGWSQRGPRCRSGHRPGRSGRRGRPRLQVGQATPPSPRPSRRRCWSASSMTTGRPGWPPHHRDQRRPARPVVRHRPGVLVRPAGPASWCVGEVIPAASALHRCLAAVTAGCREAAGPVRSGWPAPEARGRQAGSIGRRWWSAGRRTGGPGQQARQGVAVGPVRPTAHPVPGGFGRSPDTADIAPQHRPAGTPHHGWRATPACTNQRPDSATSSPSRLTPIRTLPLNGVASRPTGRLGRGRSGGCRGRDRGSQRHCRACQCRWCGHRGPSVRPVVGASWWCGVGPPAVSGCRNGCVAGPIGSVVGGSGDIAGLLLAGFRLCLGH